MGDDEPIRKVLVTGAAGLLGGHVVWALRATGREVAVLGRDARRLEAAVGDLAVEAHVGDVRDRDALRAALAGCDGVVHAAAYFREFFAPGDHTRPLREINVDATEELLRCAAAHGVRRFVHIGSAATIGRRPDGTPGDEETSPGSHARRSPYLRSKLEAHQAIRALAVPDRTAVIEILPGWMWGPGDAGPTGAGRLVLQFLAQKVPGVVAGGGSVVDARDVARASVAALGATAPGPRYIVGGRYLTMAQILATLAAVSGLPAPTRRIPYPVAWFAAIAGGHRRGPISLPALRALWAGTQVSSAKAERELRASFRPFEETALDTVRWFVEVEHGYVADPSGPRVGSRHAAGLL